MDDTVRFWFWLILVLDYRHAAFEKAEANKVTLVKKAEMSL